MKITFLGGALEVGASCILVRLDDKNILLDCGIRQSISKDPLPDFRLIQENGGVDAVVISHAHLDHTGTLPIISKEFPNAKIYMSKMSKDLVKVLLYDSIKIMNYREAEIPLYNENDVENMLNRVFCINFEVSLKMFDKMKLTLYNAGHIAGAACIYIEGIEGTVFYSGDFSVFSQKSIEGARIPKLRPDVAIFESTYGDKLHSNREIEEDRLIDLVEECVSKRGKMIIPAFALGRAQEVLLILKRAINKGKLKDVNIYADGMVRNINTTYKLNPLYLKSSVGKKILKGSEPFYDDNIKAVESKEERKKILEEAEPCVIVSSSGMLNGGPSQEYAEKISSMENGYIVMTGYQDEESPGRKLLNLLNEKPEERILEINNKKIPVKCSIYQVGLSAHSDKSEIKALISHICHGNIFLVHGEEGSINALAKEVIREVRGSVYMPKCGESFEIHVKNPRRQWNKLFPYTMNREDNIKDGDMESLWTFTKDNYGERLFTIEEILYIWDGSSKEKESEVEELQKLVLDTPYFESDERRLFLFKAAKEDEIKKKMNIGELNQTEVYNAASECFKPYSFKKIGLNIEKKVITLHFDFPLAISKEVYEKAEEFERDNKWKVSINQQTNSNALDNLIKSLLKDADIKKISHYISLKYVIVYLNKSYEAINEKEVFQETTGLELKIFGEDNSKNMENSGVIRSNNNNKMEQNEALSAIDKEFLNEEFRPYKKSIKNISGSQFIELYFITPAIGVEYREKVENLSSMTGWNMKIGTSINQNEIISIALRLCEEQGIKLKKNPSINQTSYTVTIKVEDADKEKLNKIREEFQHNTGCILVF